MNEVERVVAEALASVRPSPHDPDFGRWVTMMQEARRGARPEAYEAFTAVCYIRPRWQGRVMTRRDVLPWWLCPNDPTCWHGAIFHDVEDYDDESPTCCFEGCACGKGG